MKLRLENVCKNYNKSNRITFKIIKDISYEFESNNIYTITGKRFSGKTVLINLIGNIEEPTSGYLTIDNISYIKKKDNDKSKIKRKYFGYIFPYLDIDYNLSVIENVLIPLQKGRDRINKAKEVLNIVGISDKRNININKISSLDRFRLLLARALINDSKIILIDGMIDELNNNNQEIIMKILKEIVKDKIIIITSISKIVLDNSNYIITMSSGRIKN